MTIVAVHFENLLFLLFIAIAFVFQLLTSAANKSGKRSDRGKSAPPITPRSRPLVSTPGETDADRLRKFLEALGQSPSSEPPPPVVPRSEIPPRPLAPVQPPRGFLTPSRKIARDVGKPYQSTSETSATEPGAWLRKERPSVERLQPAQRKIFVPKSAEPATFEVREEAEQVKSAAAVTMAAEAFTAASQAKTDSAKPAPSIAALLRSPDGLRNAIILREIFGPPRSLQELDLVGV